MPHSPVLQSQQTTTHVYTDNTGGANKTFAIPQPPPGHITVLDFIAAYATCNTAVGNVAVVIREATTHGHTLYKAVSPKTLAAGDATGVHVTFPGGFPCYFPVLPSGNTVTLSDQQDAFIASPTNLLEVFTFGVNGTTYAGDAFTVGYHYEPRAFRVGPAAN
jgi:hypothetical protein